MSWQKLEAGTKAAQTQRKLPQVDAAMEADAIDIEAKPEITYDDFAKLQFQVGEIIACEAVKKSKKLLCSQVKIGSQVQSDRIRHQSPLYTGRDGRQEGYGRCQI